MSDSLWPHGLLHVTPWTPWNSPGQNTGVSSLSLLQGIFPTQGSNPGLPHCRHILYQLSHQGSLRILDWVAFSFSSRSFQPKSWTGVSCTTGGFFTNWAIREAQSHQWEESKLDKVLKWKWRSLNHVWLCDPMDGSPWNSLGKNTGVGSLSLLQEIFPTQRSNSGLPHCRRILYQLSHQGSPRILECFKIPSPADLPHPGIEPRYPALQVDSLPTELSGKPQVIGFW